MAEVIEIEFRGNVDKLRGDFNALIQDAKASGEAIKTGSDAGTQSINKTSKAVSELNKQIKEIYNEEQKLIKLRDKSTDPKKVDAYNKKIVEAKFEQRALADEIKKVNAASQNATKAGSSMVSSFKSVAATLGVAFGVAQIVNFSKEAFNLAAQGEGIRTAFSKIGGEDTLQKLRTATRGATSDIELMQAALRGKNFNISTDLLAKGLQLAGTVARTTGQDVTYLTNSFVDGLGRKSIRILDNLQISQVDLQKEIKKTGDFNTAVGNIIDKKLRETGVVVETTADKVAKLTAFWEQFKISVGASIINEFNKISDVLSVITGKVSASDIITKQALENQQKFFEKAQGEIIDSSKKSDAVRLENISKLNKQILQLAGNLRKDIESGQIDLNTDEGKRLQQMSQLQIQNMQNLQKTLREMNKVHQHELTEDELKAIADREKAKKDLRLKMLEELLALVQKTEEEAIKAGAKTDQQKLDVERDLAEQLARDARDQAIQTGTDRVVADAAYHEIVLNNKKIFAAKQEEIDEKIRLQNEKDYEDAIALADKQGEEEAKIVEKWQKKRMDDLRREMELRKKLVEEFYSFFSNAVSTAQQVNENISQSQLEDIQAKSTAETEALNEQYNQGIISKTEFEERKKAIDEKTAKEEAEVKKKAFETNKQLALIQVAISTAQAIAKTASELGYPAAIPFIALAAANAALQIAAIQSQPTPKFEKGGKVGGKRHSQGGTVIEAEVDEFVVRRTEAIRNDKLLSAINKGQGTKFIKEFYIAPALKAQRRKYEEKKDRSFAESFAKSISSGGFKDGNLLESMKMTRKTYKDVGKYIVKELKGSGRSSHKW